MAAGTLGCFDGFKGWMGQGAQARQHSRSLDASPSKKSTPSAKVALQQLPEWPGCGEELRGFWAVFAKMDLQPLTAVQQWDLREEQALDYIQQRCLRAVHPFILAMQILEEQCPLYCDQRAGFRPTIFAHWLLVAALLPTLVKYDAYQLEAPAM
mmetsp:Transcript_4227/g.5900  ORF Transcript_4227/g.5900 Transcript_4227/m.5900 type:complete len:154 (-) Transcript_4227:63-524(-)